jgi:hypothetical protein
MRKIIILVLTYDDGGAYSEMDSIVRNTWGSQHNDNIKIFYYHSKPLDSDDYIVDGDKIYCNGNESYNTIGQKTIKSFKFLITQNFDFLLRANTSSFIHLPNLIKFLNDKPLNNFYSGKLIPYHEEHLNINLASGSSYILSKDLVKYVIENENSWNHNYPDDVALGELMYKHNIKLHETEWLKMENTSNDNILKSLNDGFQIRCKIESRFDVENQIKNFNFLNKKIYNII